MEQTPQSLDFSGIAKKLKLSVRQVENVTRLLDEDNTVPFITRYRKEQTGNLDEDAIRHVEKEVQSLRQLLQRREQILRLIEGQGKLTDELKKQIEKAESLKRLEDLYQPYRPKKRTRAMIAKERGLAPFADAIWNENPDVTDLQAKAQEYVDAEKELETPQAVLQGVQDILAERVADDADVRARCRRLAHSTGRLEVSSTSKGEKEGKDYRDYFSYSESLSKIPPHRVLALNRGDKQGMLKIKFPWDDQRAVTEVLISLRFSNHRFSTFMKQVVDDAIHRLLHPSLMREIRKELTEEAEQHAVEVFAQNLKSLLLQPPYSGRKILAIDPGFRTGCKVALLDEQGVCLAHDVIKILGKEDQQIETEAIEKLVELMQAHECNIIAIGNGTACRETEELVSRLIEEKIPDAQYIIVNEAGASVYSTSEVARKEFPDLDATVRGTISIGRRLQDPLSELVKIDPQHIGVGMYQHDINAKSLNNSLTDVVESCVNYVGVDLNVASASLLTHVAGLNQLIAQRLVDFREEHGKFVNRNQLKDVSGIGEVTFTQAAGFLKIYDGDQPLDATSIHPESYEVASRILNKLEVEPTILQGRNRLSSEIQHNIQNLKGRDFANELGIGELTLQDILNDLARPGRDPRSDLPLPVFKTGILKLADLQTGMKLQGTVLNVVDFGAFVDIGLKQSGLVHISCMANRYVENPHELVSVGDVVTVWIQSIDRERERISLSFLEVETPPAPEQVPKPDPEQESHSEDKTDSNASETTSSPQTVETDSSAESKVTSPECQSFTETEQTNLPDSTNHSAETSTETIVEPVSELPTEQVVEEPVKSESNSDTNLQSHSDSPADLDSGEKKTETVSREKSESSTQISSADPSQDDVAESNHEELDREATAQTNPTAENPAEESTEAEKDSQ